MASPSKRDLVFQGEFKQESGYQLVKQVLVA